MIPFITSLIGSYNPSDWYWVVGGDTSHVWSSARATYVPSTDDTYQTWLTSGNLPTQIDTQENLMQVLLAQYPAGTPFGQLMALLNGTIDIVSTSVPAVNGTYSIDSATRGNITGIALSINAGLGLPGGGDTFNYPDASGQPHLWPAPQFIAFAKAVMNYVYAVSQVMGGHSSTIPSLPITIA